MTCQLVKPASSRVLHSISRRCASVSGLCHCVEVCRSAGEGLVHLLCDGLKGQKDTVRQKIAHLFARIRTLDKADKKRNKEMRDVKRCETCFEGQDASK